MFTQLLPAQKFSDKFAISLSVLCVLHCLFFPSFLILFSSFISLNIDSELIHYLLLFLVVPASFFALFVGLNNHKNPLIFLTGIIGILILISATIVDISILSFSSETILTIFGSLLVSFAHYKNYKLCNHMNCDCHD
tara:strand:+ start:5438 stop:5848 length:411 start_codon:yes stop_codon:yes gene_type:complete